MQPRHEYKHMLNYCDYLTIRSRLCCLMQPDSHAGAAGSYRIRSIYFDNYRDKALNDKLNGVSEREKFRIRLYNDDNRYIKLEKKAKRNKLYVKTAERITRFECERLFAGDIDFLLESGKALFAELYIKMKNEQLQARTIVEYDREPFVYAPGNVRVTFDKDVRSGLFSRDVFNPDLPLVSTQDAQRVIMEVKYDAFLPEVICDLLQGSDRQAMAISKYVLARSFE